MQGFPHGHISIQTSPPPAWPATASALPALPPHSTPTSATQHFVILGDFKEPP